MVRRVFAGCRQSLLRDGPSRRCLCNPCIGARTSTPRCPSDALTRFFSEGFGLSPRGRGSAHRIIPAAASAGSEISGLQSFSDVRAPMLAWPPGCSHPIHGLSILRFVRALDRRRSETWRQLWHAPSCRISIDGRPGRIHHAVLGWLPAPSSGIATCLNRAIDMAGLSPAGLQPCRLLPPSLAHRGIISVQLY